MKTNLLKILSVLALVECVVLGWPHWILAQPPGKIGKEAFYEGYINTITAAPPPIGEIWFSGQIKVAYHSDDVLSIKGLPQEKLTADQKAQWGGPDPYLRPAKPDEVSVTLYTQDGKRWRAKWVEEKP